MLDCSAHHGFAYLVESHMRVKPVIIRTRERSSTLDAAVVDDDVDDDDDDDDDEDDGEGTAVKLISSALPVAYCGL
jgi:hypothetical protein